MVQDFILEPSQTVAVLPPGRVLLQVLIDFAAKVRRVLWNRRSDTMGREKKRGGATTEWWTGLCYSSFQYIAILNRGKPPVKSF